MSYDNQQRGFLRVKYIVHVLVVTRGIRLGLQLDATTENGAAGTSLSAETAQHRYSFSSSLTIHLQPPYIITFRRRCSRSLAPWFRFLEVQPHHLIGNGVRQGRLCIYSVRTAHCHRELDLWCMPN